MKPDADLFHNLLMLLALAAVFLTAARLLERFLPPETDDEWVDRQW